jgi:ParB family chromosome partitioning protein
MVDEQQQLGHSKVRQKQKAQLRQAPRAVTLADLSEIAKIADPEERSAVVFRMSVGNAKSAADARRTLRVEAGVEAPVKDPVEAQFQALANAWRRAPAAVRRRFFHEFSDDIAAMEGGEA